MNANILIVDDSVVSSHFFRKVLEAENHTVIESHDGKNIIDLIEVNDIDIVLLDIVMPEKDGYEILDYLQNTDITKDIPVIMLTSLTSPKEVKKALDCGALDFIRKTCESIEVIARVHSALRLKQKQDMLKDTAQKDALTQLYNRHFFDDNLERLLKQNDVNPNGTALIMLDCDNFKTINDRYGHITGDKVLAAMANAISKSTKFEDMAYRFGGDEFSVVLPNITAFQAFAVSERIRTNIEKISFGLHDEKLTTSVSCGVGHTKAGDGKSGSDLLREADSALYTAKKNGRNQSVLFMEETNPVR